jgi:hypothetical protein
VLPVPASIAQAGASVAERFLEFFAANIRNPNARIAYARARRDFLLWTEQRGLTLAAIWAAACGRLRSSSWRARPRPNRYLITQLRDTLFAGEVILLPFCLSKSQVS